jgi:diguanylate cyclase (GGDEF)-like protein/PAS domain S-box-containing protein
MSDDRTVRAFPLQASPPAPVRSVPAMRSVDITDAYLRLIDSLTDCSMLLLDVNGYVLTWNLGAEVLKGYSAEEAVGEHISIFYTPEAVAVGHPQRELELAAMTGRYDEQGWRVRKDGTRFWAHVRIVALYTDDGELTGFGKVTTDLTAQRQKDEQLDNLLALMERTMRLDHLTGLPNRRAWDERIVEEVARAARERTPLAVAMLDVDHFKRYNDEHGHLAGDALLKQAALRWRQALRPFDMIARYGGEEFILSMPGCSVAEGTAVVDRLLHVLPDGQTASAGIAAWDGKESIDELIRRVDRALYRAKDDGRSVVRVAPGS